MAKDFCWCQLQKLLPKLFRENGSSYQNQLRRGDAEADVDGDRPSPLLVLVPYLGPVVSSLIKARLPVVELSRLKLQVAGDGQQSAVCAICLAYIDGSEEIRELANCSHVYHRACVDGWIDQGHGTCPLCRLKLLPCEPAANDDDYEDEEGEKDPWRLERIAYLFG